MRFFGVISWTEVSYLAVTNAHFRPRVAFRLRFYSAVFAFTQDKSKAGVSYSVKTPITRGSKAGLKLAGLA